MAKVPVCGVKTFMQTGVARARLWGTFGIDQGTYATPASPSKCHGAGELALNVGPLDRKSAALTGNPRQTQVLPARVDMQSGLGAPFDGIVDGIQFEAADRLHLDNFEGQADRRARKQWGGGIAKPGKYVLSGFLADLGWPPGADPRLDMDKAIVRVAVGNLIDIAPFRTGPDAAQWEHAGFQGGLVHSINQGPDIHRSVQIARILDDQVRHANGPVR
jgi:hypothetical protein